MENEETLKIKLSPVLFRLLYSLDRWEFIYFSLSDLTDIIYNKIADNLYSKLKGIPVEIENDCISNGRLYGDLSFYVQEGISDVYFFNKNWLTNDIIEKYQSLVLSPEQTEFIGECNSYLAQNANRIQEKCDEVLQKKHRKLRRMKLIRQKED